MVDPRCRPKLTDDEQNSIAQWLLQHSFNGKLHHGARKEAAETYHVCVRTISRIWKLVKAQQAQGIPVHVRNMKKGSKWKTKKKPCDLEKVKSLSVLQRSSLRVFAENMGVSKSLVHTWVKANMLVAHTSAVKPFLTSENKLTRLNWSLSQLEGQIEGGMLRFQKMYNTIHIDEKWFYLTKENGRFYLAAGEIPPHRTCKSKRFIPKIMFNCAVSRPVIDKEGKVLFDGKFGIFPFTTQEPAQRNSKNRVRGTMETHPVSAITKAVIKEQLITEIIPTIKAKWPPFLSKKIFIQQDNAKPHIQGSDPDFMAIARADGFEIHLVCQPPNSPDTNVNDLGFFRAIQALKDQMVACGLDELMENVIKAYEGYHPMKLNYVFLTLQGCYTEIMKAKGDNNYKVPHMGKEALQRLGKLPECLEVSEEVVRESLEHLNLSLDGDDRFYNLDKLIEGMEQVDMEAD